MPTEQDGRGGPQSLKDVPVDVVEDAVFEIRQRAEFVGWTDYEREQQYHALAEHLLDAKQEWPVGVGAVLYGPDGDEEARDLWHVTDRLTSVDGDRRLVVLWDGTHTSRRYVRAEDLLAEYTPAGWSWPTGQKPLYHLTRQCGADDRADLMTDGGEDVEITHDEARDESRCGLFCDEEPDVSFEAFGYTFHRCQSCYEEPCSRCGEEIEDDSNKPKGWCQSCREEIRLICGGDEERGIEKDEDNEQTTLLTDGGRAEYDRDTPCADGGRDVPKSVRVRTDPDDGLAYRFDAIQSAADYWDCNKSKAVVKSCDAVGDLVDNVEDALQHEDLPPSVARELADAISTRQISVDYQGPDVEVNDS